MAHILALEARAAYSNATAHSVRGFVVVSTVLPHSNQTDVF